MFCPQSPWNYRGSGWHVPDFACILSIRIPNRWFLSTCMIPGSVMSFFARPTPAGWLVLVQNGFRGRGGSNLGGISHRFHPRTWCIRILPSELLTPICQVCSWRPGLVDLPGRLTSQSIPATGTGNEVLGQWIARVKGGPESLVFGGGSLAKFHQESAVLHF